MSDRSFVSAATRTRIRGMAVPVAVALGRIGLTPNALTVIGFAGMVAAAVAAAYQLWIVAGILVIAFGIFDLFDGALARATGRASKFGAFLDSTLDRTGESLVLVGVAVGYAASGFAGWGVALAGLAATFASVVTYTRAKAESLGVHGEVGIAPRPERLVILAVGLIGGGLVWPSIDTSSCEGCAGGAAYPPGVIVIQAALALIALLSAITIVQRLIHVKHQLDEQENS
jgi:CDP-diacylglycerol--glycerol-3-phosphate 3-phosphatidyltransferase